MRLTAIEVDEIEASLQAQGGLSLSHARLLIAAIRQEWAEQEAWMAREHVADGFYVVRPPGQAASLVEVRDRTVQLHDLKLAPGTVFEATDSPVADAAGDVDRPDGP